MKILQTIVSSSPETLDGRQGFGLVVCSRLMPDAVRKVARDWEYPSHGDGKPVYSFLIVEDRDVSWAVMNHTIPATDFTGRSSYVSHTLAIRLDELSEWFGQRPGHVMTPFEVMHDFKWRQTWSEADSPHFIESEEDKEIGEVFSQKPRSEGYRAPGIASSPLLAFDYSENGDIRPKRVGWKVWTCDPGEMLRLFHSAWITLDPWRGGRIYGDHLGEPNVSLLDSWGCTFATDLRGGRPDEYDWVVLAANEASIASRKTIDVAEWIRVGDDDVAEEIGGVLGRLLVDRSKNPDGWAQEQIKRKIGDIAAVYRERTGERAKSTEDDIKKLIASIEHDTKQWNEYAKKDLDADLAKALSILSHKKIEMSSIVESARRDSFMLDGEFNNEISPLRNLISGSVKEDVIGDLESIWFYPELQKQFDDHNEAFRKIFPYGEALRKIYNLEGEIDEKRATYQTVNDALYNDKKNLEQKVEKLARELSEKSLPKRSLRDENPSSKSIPSWQLYSLMGLASLLAIAVSYLVMTGKTNPTSPGAAQSKQQKSEAQLGRENVDLYDKITGLEKTITDLNNKLSGKDADIKKLDNENKQLSNQIHINEREDGRKAINQVNPNDQNIPSERIVPVEPPGQSQPGPAAPNTSVTPESGNGDSTDAKGGPNK